MGGVGPTNLDLVRADVEHSHHPGDERTEGPEVEAPDAPGPVHQQHNIGLRFGLARHACGVGGEGGGAEGATFTRQQVLKKRSERRRKHKFHSQLRSR